MALTKEEKAARRAAAAGTNPKPSGVAPEVRPGVCGSWDSDTGCWRTPGGSKHLVQRNRKRKLAAADTQSVCMDIDTELAEPGDELAFELQLQLPGAEQRGRESCIFRDIPSGLWR